MSIDSEEPSVADGPQIRKEWTVITSTGPDSGTSILRPVGEVDIAVADDLYAAASACLDDAGARRLVVDLGEVTFLDSTGLGALVRTRNQAQELGKDLVIANVSETVMKVFRITGLSEALTFENGTGADADVSDGPADD